MIPLLAIIIFMMNFFSSLQAWEGLNDSMLMGIDIFLADEGAGSHQFPPSTASPGRRKELFVFTKLNKFRIINSNRGTISGGD